MNQDHVRFAEWDAAYVVRALSSGDRRLYEAHLDECALCRAAIGELTPTLGLLARLDRERAESLLDPPGPGPDAAGRARLVAHAAHAARRRRTVAWVGGLAAAAVIALIVAFGAPLLAPAPRPQETVALEAVTDVPLTATVELTDVAWGTRIAMECAYPRSSDADAPEREWPYVLVVTAVDGTTSELSSWRAGPGTTAHLTAGTALDRAEIASIEVRSLTDHRVLLRGEPSPPAR